jgi:protein-tyrosine-phosphatase
MKQAMILFSCILLTCLTAFKAENSKTAKLFSPISKYLQSAEKEFDQIPDDRKTQLKKVALFVKSKLSAEKKVNLVFICTHNSRRSHMAQLWAYAAAEYYGVTGVQNFSGGTENTAFNERAVKALTGAGFIISKKTAGSNPTYEVKYAEGAPAITAFSKKYMDAPNPSSNFAAIMTCSHADKNCPTVVGASVKIAIPYEDPKEADGKANETAVYNERSRQIAREMLYIFSLVKSGN